jgi:hypothetical protein
VGCCVGIAKGHRKYSLNIFGILLNRIHLLQQQRQQQQKSKREMEDCGEHESRASSVCSDEECDEAQERWYESCQELERVL